jgi:MFS family permease
LAFLAAAELLAPTFGPATAAWVMVLYAWHNVCQALAAFPVGALSDRVGRRPLLVLAYALGAAVSVGLAVALWSGAASVSAIVALLGLSGVYVAVEEALESAMSADLVPDSTVRGTAYGVLGAVNGVGDLVASLLVGALWLVAPPLGFGVAAGLMGLGAVLLQLVR